MPAIKDTMAYFDLPTAHKDGTKDIKCGSYPRKALINEAANLEAGFTQVRVIM